MNTTLRTASLVALVGLGVLAEARPAAACAVFTPPVAPIVTDHRMIVSVGRDESTLYDEVRYQGSPESFAWVLPISGEAKVGLSAEVLFSALDARTRVTVRAPDAKCPPPPPSSERCAERGAGFGNPGVPNDGVTVTKREVVGPYETVQLQSSDPKALTDWLGKNGFVVPDDVKPLVATYVAEKLNFLAMKLVPGQNVKSMRPIRVTTKGSNVTVPLRSISAGTGPSVKLALWVVGEGRYEPVNFPTYTIPSADLVWDWTTNASNRDALKSEKLGLSKGRGWELHSSIDLSIEGLRQEVASPRRYEPNDPNAPSDYAAIEAKEGLPGKTVAQVRDEDLAVLGGSSTRGLRVTFLQAELPRESLGSDMVLAASSDQSSLAAERTVAKEIGEPQCPVYGECGEIERYVPRSEAEAAGGSSAAASSGCSTTQGTSSGPGIGSLLAVLGVTLAGLRARRRRTR
jgi:MYXO-CTERM domain-containing protein